MPMHRIRSVASVANLLLFGALLARQNDVVKGEPEKILTGVAILRKGAFVRIEKF
jgi:3-deoxy-D-manno-octulosonic acid (KDO) 8-phosphate synthase